MTSPLSIKAISPHDWKKIDRIFRDALTQNFISAYAAAIKYVDEPKLLVWEGTHIDEFTAKELSRTGFMTKLRDNGYVTEINGRLMVDLNMVARSLDRVYPNGIPPVDPVSLYNQDLQRVDTLLLQSEKKAFVVGYERLKKKFSDRSSEKKVDGDERAALPFEGFVPLPHSTYTQLKSGGLWDKLCRQYFATHAELTKEPLISLEKIAEEVANLERVQPLRGQHRFI